MAHHDISLCCRVRSLSGAQRTLTSRPPGRFMGPRPKPHLGDVKADAQRVVEQTMEQARRAVDRHHQLTQRTISRPPFSEQPLRERAYLRLADGEPRFDDEIGT